MAYGKAKSLLNNFRLSKTLIITSIFITLGILEYSTPNNYVFGYLYSGAILIVSSWFGEVVTLQATLLAITLTMLNIWIPGREVIQVSTVANRAIASMALIVTGFLSQRLRKSHEAINNTKAKLEAQEKLAQLREDFASTLTHDLKTPLLGAIETIKGFQQQEFGMVTSTQQQVLATMIRSHENSLKFVETLLDVYRNDAEGIRLNSTPVNLVDLAENVAASLVTLAAKRRIHISFNYGESDFRRSLWVLGDTFQLQRVFTNLLVNAINHSRKGDRIEVVFDSQASYQLVKILDTGAGILPEHFPYLFERFYQGYSDRQAKGSGLGLYLSRQIIAAHGGIIWAENRIDVETGAMFAFKLPVYLFQQTR